MIDINGFHHDKVINHAGHTCSVFFNLNYCTLVDYDYERQHLLARMPDTDFISLTSGTSGKRYYLAQKDEDDLTQEVY
jgi:hypothetical protein